MKVLKILATPFIAIWRWIKETAWVQPLLIVGLIFGIMLGDALPHISVALGMVLVILSGIIIGLPNLLKDLRSIKGERI